MGRLIDADALIKSVERCFTGELAMSEREKVFADVPTIEIVRCKECKYWVSDFHGCSRNACAKPWYADDYCSYGEREGE